MHGIIGYTNQNWLLFFFFAPLFKIIFLTFPWIRIPAPVCYIMISYGLGSHDCRSIEIYGELQSWPVWFALDNLDLDLWFLCVLIWFFIYCITTPYVLFKCTVYRPYLHKRENDRSSWNPGKVANHCHGELAWDSSRRIPMIPISHLIDVSIRISVDTMNVKEAE